jgi:hypothetical protein
VNFGVRPSRLAPSRIAVLQFESLCRSLESPAEAYRSCYYCPYSALARSTLLTKILRVTPAFRSSGAGPRFVVHTCLSRHARNYISPACLSGNCEYHH